MTSRFVFRLWHSNLCCIQALLKVGFRGFFGLKDCHSCALTECLSRFSQPPRRKLQRSYGVLQPEPNSKRNLSSVRVREIILWKKICSNSELESEPWRCHISYPMRPRPHRGAVGRPLAARPARARHKLPWRPARKKHLAASTTSLLALSTELTSHWHGKM